MLYSEDIWTRFVRRIEEKNAVKRYLHFDHRFDFSARKNEIQDLVRNTRAVASHSFLPLVKIIIKTPRYRYQEDEGKYSLETKSRPISFASHFDTYLYAFYSFALGERYQQYIRDNGFSESVLAYRNDLEGKCNIQFAKEIFEYIRGIGPCAAIALDIKGYFDSIDHLTLKQSWCKVLGISELPKDQYKILRSLTKYSYVNKNSVLRHFGVDLRKQRQDTLTDIIPGKTFKEKFDLLREHNLIVVNDEHEPLRDNRKRFYGIPQGSALSALLSNIYLMDFDKEMVERGKKEGFLYRRYCDDILIVAPSANALKIHDETRDLISKFHLMIQSKKTELVLFAHDRTGKLRGFDIKKMSAVSKFGELNDETRYYKNLQYLGFEFNGQNIYIRSGSLSRYFRKMKARIVRTVMMWSGKNSQSPNIFKKQLYDRYTHLGDRNFLTYAYNASKKYYVNAQGHRKDGMNSAAIRKQISKHFEILLKSLESKKDHRENTKLVKAS